MLTSVGCTVRDSHANGSATTTGVPKSNDAGGADGMARMIKYLNALRGPAGQGLRYRDAGQAMAGVKGAMLNRFDVEYSGVAQPIRLYFDSTREEPLFAPQGFLCAAPLGAS